jgi:ornithine carbamoyltransferase
MSVRHFIDLDQIEPAALRAILDDAHARKRARAGQPKGAPDRDAPLSGYVLAAIFEKNSTRTRVSFDMAMRQLGGATLTMSAADTQLGRGEPIEDTARVLSRMVDGVMIRANAHATLTTFAQAADVPVINGLTDRSHPCQILADLMTLEERGVSLRTARIAWMGDGNNVCASLIQAAPVFGYQLTIATPGHYRPDPKLLAEAKARGGDVSWSEDPHFGLSGADCVITDTWVSMGDTDKSARMQALGPYQVDRAVMQMAAANATFLHCLPAHRDEEVSAEVIDGAQSAVFDEAENRLHVQKSILLWCFSRLSA